MIQIRLSKASFFSSRFSKWVVAFLMGFAITLVAGAIAHAAPTSNWIEGSQIGPAGSLQYRLYLNKDAQNTGFTDLFVALHGCKQNTKEFDLLTGFSKQAEAKKTAVLFLEQSVFRNIDHCWNWFLKSNQVGQQANGQNFSETGLILQTLEFIIGAYASSDFKKNYKVGLQRVGVAGFSAGGAMAALLGSCYPAVFDRVGVHSGVSFGLVSDQWPFEWSAEAALVTDPGRPIEGPEGAFLVALNCSGLKRRYAQNVAIVHGNLDTRVLSSHALYLYDFFKTSADYADDAQLNKSYQSSAVEKSEDLISSRGVRYHQKWIVGSNSNAESKKQGSVSLWTLESAGHVWSGGRKNAPRSLPDGPSATRLFLDLPRRPSSGAF